MYESFIPPLPHPDSDRAQYRAQSWKEYFATIDRHATPGRLKTDQGAYLPTPDDIDEALGVMRWMESLGFDGPFITSVMVHDTPTLEKLMQLIERHGAAETYRRCRPFIHLPDGEDDDDS